MAPTAGYAIADIATLKRITAENRGDGYSLLVKITPSGPCWYTYIESSAATANDIDTLLPNDSPASGRWIKSNAPAAAASIPNFNEAVDDRVSALIKEGDNISLVYDDTANTLTVSSTSGTVVEATTTSKGIVQLAGDIAGTAASVSVTKIQGRAIAATAPSEAQVLTWNAVNNTWQPGTVSTGYAPVSSSIASGLLSFWKFEEASGIRNDSVGTNNLTVFGTTQVTGKIGNAVNLVTGDYLSTNGNSPDLRILSSSSFTVAGWIKPSTLNANRRRTIISKLGYSISIGSLNDLAFSVQNSNGGEAYISVSLPTANIWYFFIADYNTSTKKISLQLNNGTPTTGDCIPGNFSSSSIFYIGCLDPTTNQLDGSVDAIGIWSKVLTVEEKTYLYNSGNGIEFPFTARSGAITISDEGTQLTTTASSLNFTGAGVTATNNSGAITVNIPGGTSSTGGNVNDATTTTKGIIQLADNLGGTADAPKLLKITEAVTGTGTLDLTGSTNKIRFHYDSEADLPSPSVYHGMFAHVHATGYGYVAHAGTWHKLAPLAEKDLAQWNSDRIKGVIVDDTAKAAGKILRLNAAGDRIIYVDPPAGTGGSAIVVQDEGTQITSSVTAFNFTGAGVQATNNSGVVTVSVTANSTGGNFDVNSILTDKTTSQILLDDNGNVLTY